MLEITKLRAACRTTEVSTVSDSIINEYRKSDWSSDAHLTGIFTRYVPFAQNMTLAINRIKAESDLEAKDEIRDGLVRDFYYLVTGYTHHREAAIKTAAGQIEAVFEHYGMKIIDESYVSESALVKSLLADLATAEMQTAISALSGVSAVITELTAAQNSFENAFVLFEKEKMLEGAKETAYEIKGKIIKLVNEELIVHLRAMVNIDETKYGEFAGTVAQIINDSNSEVKSRKKSSEAPVNTEQPAAPAGS